MEIIVSPLTSLPIDYAKFYFDNSGTFGWLDRYSLPAVDAQGNEIEPTLIKLNGDTEARVTFGWQAYSAINFPQSAFYPIFPNPTGSEVREFHVAKGSFSGTNESAWLITSDVISVQWRSGPGSTIINVPLIEIKSPQGLSPASFYGDGQSNSLTYWATYLSGNDTITASNGNDTIFGYAGVDVLNGGAGDDILAGGAGSDSLYGGAGNDTLFAFQEYDDAKLSDAEFSNLLASEKGSEDRLYGGSGDDLYVIDRYVNAPKIYENAGEGVDTILGDLELYNVDANVENYINDRSISGSAVTINGNSLNNIIKTSPESWRTNQDILNSVDQTFDAKEIFNGYGGDDLLISGLGDDTLNGGSGNDILRGGEGNDILDGGDGVDTADYSDRTQQVVFEFKGNLNANVQVGGVSEDTITNIENVIGGSGDDRFIGDNNNNAFIGGEGIDSVEYGTAAAGVRVDLQAGIARSLTGNLANIGNDSLNGIEKILGSGYDDQLVGNGFSNQLSGGSGDDLLDGGAGADTLIGGLGDDRYFVDNQRDVIVESPEDDRNREVFSIGHDNDAVVTSVSYTLGSNVAVEDMIAAGVLTGSRLNANLNLTGNDLGQGVLGNDATNILMGMDGKDTLVGMGGNDKLFGGNDNDRLIGGAGNDALYGDAGDDLFAFGFGFADGWDFNYDPIKVALTGGRDQADGGSGTDSLAVRSLDPASIVIERDTTRSGYDFIVSGLNRESMQIKNIEQISFVELASGINISRTFTLSATSAQFTVGDDWVIGTTGIDTLQGGAGNDILQGGRGNDILKGGLGNDVLIGGAGSDRFVFDVLGGFDKIADFARGDKIQLDDAVFARLATNFNSGNIVNLTDAQMKSGQYFNDDYLIFNKTTKTLFYDADGSGSGQSIALAEIANVNVLAYSDFLIV